MKTQQHRQKAYFLVCIHTVAEIWLGWILVWGVRVGACITGASWQTDQFSRLINDTAHCGFSFSWHCCIFLPVTFSLSFTLLLFLCIPVFTLSEYHSWFAWRYTWGNTFLGHICNGTDEECRAVCVSKHIKGADVIWDIVRFGCCFIRFISHLMVQPWSNYSLTN